MIEYGCQTELALIDVCGVALVGSTMYHELLISRNIRYILLA